MLDGISLTYERANQLDFFKELGYNSRIFFLS